MQLDRKTLFDHLRVQPFGGRMYLGQVQGTAAILDEWETGAYGEDPRHLANVLAQVFHETGGRMVPVREGFAAGDAAARKAVARRKYGAANAGTGQVYYGRGPIQLTWAENYKKLGTALDIDLYGKPDLALDPATGAKIALLGMSKGLFARDKTGPHKLDRYFNATVDDPVGARRIVNGTDKAAMIAGYHDHFLESVTAAVNAPARAPVVAARPETIKAIQQQLRDKGWPEVGNVDGKFGPRTRDTLAAAASHYGWPSTELDDTLIANLVRAPRRELDKSRKEATEKDLAGSKSVRQGLDLKRWGQIVIGLSGLGGLAQGTASLDDLTGSLGKIRGFAEAVTALPWWMPAGALGAFVIWRGSAVVREQVAAYREGRHV